MNSLFPDICTDNVTASKDYYMSLLGLDVVFEIDWYVQLKSPVDDNLQIAFVDTHHPSVPVTHQKPSQGVVVTVESNNVDDIYRKATELKLPVVMELCDEDWGQRHFMLEDPNGLLVDVYKAIEPTQSFMEQYS